MGFITSETPNTNNLFSFLLSLFPFVTLVALVALVAVLRLMWQEDVFGQGNVWVKIHRILISRFKALLSAFLGSGGTTIHPRGENRFWGKLEGFLRVSVAWATMRHESSPARYRQQQAKDDTCINYIYAELRCSCF